MSDFDFFEVDADETTYAQGRQPDRTYASRSFPLHRTNSPDDGAPARFVYKVYDPETETETTQGVEGAEWFVASTPQGRYQTKLLVAGEPGNVKELWIQRVPGSGAAGQVKVLLNLVQPELGKLIDLIKSLDSIPVEGAQSVRIDDDLLREILSDPAALRAMYRSEEDRIRRLIEEDDKAEDVVALAARRARVAEFRRLLTDDAYFDDCARGPGPERVWQDFFEQNPWIFGLNLGAMFLTRLDRSKLEQVVVGASIAGPGKRSDAVMRTAGRIRSMVLAEIKTHRTPLLATSEYRSGCWAASADLAGAVAQAHGTVHRAVTQIGERLAATADDGSEIPGDFTYLVRPRSFLVIGDLAQLSGQGGGDHPDKVRSFELYRRQLMEPEIITFDELLARAEWSVSLAAGQEHATAPPEWSPPATDEPW